MYVENVGARIQKLKLRDIFHFYVKSRLTLSPIHIFIALFTYSGEVVT